MRPSIGAIVSVVFCCAALGGEQTIDEFVRAPEISRPPSKTEQPRGNEFVQQTGGAHKGHRILSFSVPLSAEGKPPYCVRYAACLDKSAHPSAVDLIAKEGLSGVGISKPTGCNWYSGGCIDVVIAGQSLGPYRPSVERSEYANGSASALFRWRTPYGPVTLRFTQLAGDEKVHVTGIIEAPVSESVQVALCCYPSGYGKPWRRVAVTARTVKEAPGRLVLTPRDSWIAYYDANHDRAEGKGSGTCALMFSPNEFVSGTVKVGAYPISTRLTLRPGRREFHLVLWEFPELSNTETVARMKQIAGALAPPSAADLSRLVPVGKAPPRAIVVDGKPAAVIAVGDEENDRLIQAAQEIREYVAKSSGAVLPIVTGKEAARHRNILIESRTPPRGAGAEGFSIKTRGDGATITGNSPLAALYGACEFLERVVGVRWYLPGDLGEVVPKHRTITLPKLDIKQSPTFPMRWIGTGRWAVHNKQNRCEDGFLIYPSIYHTQNVWLPHAELFRDHPEYFALVKGKRSAEGQCKLCNANREGARMIASNMARALDENPAIDLLSFSPTDGMLYCECEECKALDDRGDMPRDQRMSRRMLVFYNAIAETLARTHPRARMLVGAYHVYTWPPADEKIKAHPMLNVIICHYEDYCLAHSVGDPDCPPNERYRRLIKAWQDLGCRVYFYEYYWKVNWLDLPWPIVHSIRQDMPWYKANDIQGVYTQYTTDNIWTLFPAHYAAARLLWNVNCDVDGLLDRMYRDLFGRAAPAMKKYYEVMERRTAECGAHFPGRGLQFGPVVFDEETRTAMRREYERAVKLNDDPVVARRLQKIGASLEYVERLMNYAAVKARITSEKDPQKSAEKAVEACSLLSELVREIRTDRVKWGGVVSRSVVQARAYLGRELETMEKRRARVETTTLFERIAPLPVTWRFSLDEKDIGRKDGWFKTDFDDSAWKEIEIARTWESQGYDYDGFAWYRVKVNVKPEWAKRKGLFLLFGAVDGEGWVYWNGKLLGHHKGWDEPFSLPLDPKDVKTNAPNLIAVRVFDGAHQGGIYKSAWLAARK